MDKDERADDLEFETVTAEEGSETDLEDVEELGKDKIRKLQKKLKSCEAEKMQHLEDLQRAKAEFLNSRKMLEAELERDRERITEKHLRSLLPLADSFDMATQDPAWEHCDEKWRKGIEGIRGQLTNILKQYGVEPIDAAGVAFDPNEHEAVMQEVVTDAAAVDTVVRVLQTGYRKREAILRHAKVAVGIKE